MPHQGAETPGRQDLIEQVMVAGRTLSTATVMFHTALAEKVGLSSTEDKAMELLDRLGPLTAGQLSEHSGLAPATVTALIDRLERKKFARRVPNPKDGRSVLIEPVPESIRSIGALLVTWVADLNEMLAQYDDDQLQTIATFLAEAAVRQQKLTVQLTDRA